MAWIEPVTDREAGSRTTYEDMNRICGNLEYKGFTLTKSTYADGDIVTKENWAEIVTFAKTGDQTLTESTDYANLNALENAINSADPSLMTIDITYSADGVAETTVTGSSYSSSSLRSTIKAINDANTNVSMKLEGKILCSSLAYLFNGDTNIVSIDLSDLDTSKVTSLTRAFQTCTGLTSVDMSGMDTSNVTDFSYLFGSCSALTTINLSGIDTSSAISFDNMFGYCRALASLDLSGFDTSSVTNFSSMFTYCQSLTSLNLSGFDTSNAERMGNMFGYCIALTTLDLSSFNTSKVTSMVQMFQGCTRLASVNLRSFNTSLVTNMFYMFANCTNLVTVYASSNFVTEQVTQSNYMFSGCVSIRGGNGTTYNASYRDKTYARIDTAGSPGYFTA